MYCASNYTLAVTEAKAATLVLPYDAIIPENVKAYTLTYTSGATKATATEVTGNAVSEESASNETVVLSRPQYSLWGEEE